MMSIKKCGGNTLEKLEKKLEGKITLILFITMVTIFTIPSIVYFVSNKTVYDFNALWTFLAREPIFQNEPKINAILFGSMFTSIFLLYLAVVKENKKIFKNNKEIFAIITITSMLFLLIIPYTSTDVYSYIGNGWSTAHYGENPYYTSIGEIQEKNSAEDPMFHKVSGNWLYEKVIYGPLWTIICTVLAKLSFGNIDLALLIFKVSNLCMHILNCFLIYKITRKKSFVLLYGLNPFILFEAIANVHNDIFIVSFILLAIYCIKQKKNIYMAVASIAMATAIKYMAILILPFILIYALRDKEVKERIKYCILCGLEYIAILVMIYLIYMRDFQVLAGILIQQGKYRNSIFYMICLLARYDLEKVIIIQKLSLGIFALYYIYVVVKLLLQKNIEFKEAIKKYQIILFIFIFILITNFNPWYLMWLFPTMFWLDKTLLKNIILLSYTSQIANIFSFALCSEYHMLSIVYVTIMILSVAIANLVMKFNEKKMIERK